MSRLSQYLNRSSKLLRDNTARVLRMEGADPLNRAPKLLYAFNSKEDVEQFATGCDADVGGLSTVNFELDDSHASMSSSSPGAEATEHAVTVNHPTARFWGEMRLGVRSGLEEKIRGGYAGFRNKPRTSLFGEITDDVSLHDFLALRLRARGHPRTRNSYFVNIQTDGPITTDLWQHRLFFRRDDGMWEDVFIPFKNFVLTNAGELVSQQVQMYRERVRTIGISLLGGNSGIEGPYELNIDSIRVVNAEDVTETSALGSTSSDGTPWARPPVL